MARRRSFYARDRHGRFARTSGVYRRRLSTGQKVAIAGAGAVAVGTAALGAKQAYRAGARKGWEVGKAHGVYEGKPLRGSNGRMLPNSAKRDVSQNPYARGYRPVARNNAARRKPGVKTRIRASRVASHRIDQNYARGNNRLSGFHVEKRVKQARSSAGRRVRGR